MLLVVRTPELWMQGAGALIASYADILWARHAIFLPHVRGGGRLRDEPKECLRLRRRLEHSRS